MNEKVEFKSEKSLDELKKETINYFQSQGFTLVNSATSYVQFERGSVLRNMMTFNPLKWKSSIKVEFDNGSVIANFDIDTIHQAVTLEEEKLWNKFISNYQSSIESGKSMIAQNKRELKVTKKSSLEYVKYAILGGLIFGIPGGLIAHFTGIDMFVTMAAVAGALIFLMKKIHDKRGEAVIDKS